MRITFMQSGGFAGGIRGVRIDVAGLGEAERKELLGLVDACGIVDSFERFSAPGRDLRQYDLAIERDAATLRVSCDEHCLPAAARRLVSFLSARATPQPATFQMPAAGAAATVGAEWGLFDGDVVARWEDDGRQMTLVEDFAYVDPRQVRWAAAAGSVVNGASIPRAFWSLIGGPFEGRFRKASVVHDVACVARERRWQDVHRMFHDASRCGGVGAAQAATLYYAVYHFGPRWRIEERATVVAGATRKERVVHDETPAAPTGAEVSAIEAYFVAHEVAPETIPALAIRPASYGSP